MKATDMSIQSSELLERTGTLCTLEGIVCIIMSPLKEINHTHLNLKTIFKRIINTKTSK